MESAITKVNAISEEWMDSLSGISASLSIAEWGDIFSIVTGVASLFVAGIALHHSVQQSKANRLHNQLSVRPHLESSIHHCSETNILTFSVENAGLGPAFFYKVESICDSVECPARHEPVQWVLRNILTLAQKNSAKTDQIAPGCALLPGDSLRAFRFEATKQEADRFLRELATRSLIKVIYRSAYEEEFTMTIADNTRYGPNEQPLQQED